MLVEAIPIEEPKWEILGGNTSPVPVPKNVRTTIFSIGITVPKGKTEVFLCARTWLNPYLPIAARTAYIAVDGVDIAQRYSEEVNWLPVYGWTTLTPGEHTVTVDMLQNQDGKTGELADEKGLVMVCRAPGDKYVSFSDTDVRKVFSRAKKVKVIVGVKGLSYGDGPPYAYCYVKTTDKFGNMTEQMIDGEWTVNPILHEFALLDTVDVELRSGHADTGSWISYLNVIYEV